MRVGPPVCLYRKRKSSARLSECPKERRSRRRALVLPAWTCQPNHIVKPSSFVCLLSSPIDRPLLGQRDNGGSLRSLSVGACACCCCCGYVALKNRWTFYRIVLDRIIKSPSSPIVKWCRRARAKQREHDTQIACFLTSFFLFF